MDLKILLAALMLVFSFGGISPTFAVSFETNCAVTSGGAKGNRFVRLRCTKVGSGSTKIESIYYEKKDPKAFKGWIRSAGRKFTCTAVRTGIKRVQGGRQRVVKLTNCK